MRGVSPPRAALFALLRPLIACLFLLASSPLAGDATAQTGAQLRHARAQARGGRVAEGVLTRFSSGRLTLVARETHELSVRDLIRLDFTSRTPRLDRRDPVVILANGDLLAAQADEADPEYLGARWTRLGALPSVKIPLEAIRALLLRRPADAADDQRLWRRLADSQEEDDALLLSNGDVLTGELTRLDRDTLNLSGAGAPGAVPRSSVDAVIFNAELAQVEPLAGPGAQISLIDGSRFHATDIELVAGELVRCKAQFGAELEFPAVAVCGIRFVGGCATWLSALEPVTAEFTPFLTTEWPWRRDRNCLAQPLRLRGVDYPSGLGVHSRCLLTYRLDDQYREFHVTAGIDDSARGKGNAIFEIQLDGETAWRAKALTGVDEPAIVGPLDVEGRRELVLKVDFGEAGDVLDHADWCDAVLVRSVE